MTSSALTALTPGQPIVFGGDRVTTVPAELAGAFRPGDRLVVVQTTGDLLHIPLADHELAAAAVADAAGAFIGLGEVGDDEITAFYAAFAAALVDDATFAAIASANDDDVADARRRGRSTTRLVLTPSMRAGMIDGLRGWCERPGRRDQVISTVVHEGWHVAEHRAPLGVVGFVFEGRPNVFADATGVLRTGNTVVFRIGSDALRTARAIMTHAVEPALASAGLPAGAVRLLDAPSRAAGWALFSDPRLALAVARGSGTAVEQLGAVARQSGVPVSLHGTGGAWMIVGDSADPDRLADVVMHSLDRKVCNTLNVCCLPAGRAGELLPLVVDAAERAAGARGTVARLHLLRGGEAFADPGWFTRRVTVERAEGDVDEPFADVVEVEALATEWEWEQSPELTIAVVESSDEAAELFNRYSPRFVASVLSGDDDEHRRMWARLDAPFVGDGFTRWVDGQYALGVPELGLSNWQSGRLACRGGVLSGESIFTVRLRVTQDDPGLHR